MGMNSYYDMSRRLNKRVESKRKNRLSQADKIRIAIGTGAAIPIILTVIR